MKIEHIAIWTNQLEHMSDFYCRYFECNASKKYYNKIREFESVFLTFDTGSRIELMRMPDIVELEAKQMVTCMGLTHLAISVGSEMTVKRLTEDLRSDGYTIAGEPRTTGDGYFESVILDPDGNAIEITV